MSTDPAATFEPHRRRLLGLAYRMLGSMAEAEDAVQETYLRWHAADRGRVGEPRAFLMTATTRICLDVLKSARRGARNTSGRGCPIRSSTLRRWPRTRRPSWPRISRSRCCWRWSGCRRSSAPRSCCTTGSIIRSRRSPTFDTINGLPGVLVESPRGLVQTTAFEIEGGVIEAIYIVRNPDKLRHLA